MAFMFHVLEFVKNKEDLFAKEQEWLDRMDIENNYNIMGYSHCEYADRLKENYSDVLNFELSEKQKKLLKRNLIIFQNKKLYLIGENKNDLSKQWFGKSNQNTFKQLTNNIANFAKHYLKTRSKDYYWTTHVSYQNKFKIRGAIKCFVSLIDIPIEKRNVLIFVLNVFPNPWHTNLNEIDVDKYSLNILLKWIINTANIKNNISLYIPSLRMRMLLENYISTI